MSSMSASSAKVHTTDFEDSSISEDCRSLARRLSGHMGIDHALQISNENQWHGVVAALREMQRKK